MRVTTTKLYCDKCGKLLKEGFLKDWYTIPIAYKSIVMCLRRKHHDN